MTVLTKNKIITLGSTVIVEISGRQFEYTILESAIADINKNEISSDSPIGKNILGHKEGQNLQVSLPGNRLVNCKILKIK